MKSKYYYNGEPLVDYCKKHPEFRYDRLIKYISVKKKEDPSRDANDLINEFLNKEHKSYTRYIINGMNLRRYCSISNISYDAVTKDISRSRKDEKYKDMSEEEIINMILEKHIIGNNIEELELGIPKKLMLDPKKRE